MLIPSLDQAAIKCFCETTCFSFGISWIEVSNPYKAFSNNSASLKSMEWDQLIPSFGGSKRSKQEHDDFRSLLKRFRRCNSLVIAEASAALKRIEASAFKSSPQLETASAELEAQKRKTTLNSNLMRMVEMTNPCIDDYLTVMKEAEELGYYLMDGPTV